MESANVENPQGPTAGVPRDRSTVDFVYTDLDNAVEIAQGVHQAGGTACDYDQLAAQVGLEAKGGGFRLRVIGAKAYGLITYERGGRITLTDLGKRIIDSQQERTARVDAFLHVELYQKVFEQFKGSPLPPQAGLERALVSLGVGDKVKDKARQVLLRSAKQAGFFELSTDRLTKPPIKNDSAPQKQNPPVGEQNRNGGGNDGGNGGNHPFIEGLLKTLPTPETDWPITQRMKWLQTAAGIFGLIYTGDEGTEVIEITKKSL